MRDSGPNWGLAFGSASFLIVWCLGFLSGLSIEVIALRACVATMVGALVGLVFDQTLRGIRAIQEDQSKGSKVDFTVPAGDDELPASPAADRSPSEPSERTSVVPQASDDAPGEAFQPLDFKTAARQIQSTMKE